MTISDKCCSFSLLKGPSTGKRYSTDTASLLSFRLANQEVQILWRR